MKLKTSTAKELALAMESMKVVAAFISNDKNVTVRYNNNGVASADTEKGIINIPRISEIDEESMMKLRTFVYHEGGHIVETKLSKEDTPKEKPLFQILNALEDVRMEKILIDKYLGCSLVLKWSWDYFNKKNGANFIEGKVKAPFWEALIAMMYAVRNVQISWTLSEKAQWYYDLSFNLFQGVWSTKSTSDCLVIAKKIYEKIKEEAEKEKEQEEGDDKEEGDSSSQSESGEEESKEEQDSEQESDSPSSGEDTKETKAKKEKQKEKIKEEVQKELEADCGKSNDILKDQLIEEIQTFTKEYKPDFDEYTAFKDSDSYNVPDVTPENIRAYKELQSNLSSQILSMSRCLDQSLRSIDKVHKISHFPKGKLDMRQIVKLGKSLSNNVFYQKFQKEAKNTAIEIVIDESGSMSSNCAYISMQKLAAVIAETLTRIGMPFEIFGATTGYPIASGNSFFTRGKPIQYYIYKVFDEKWQTVKERVMNIRPHDNYIDGEVVEFAARRLAQRSEHRKIVFSLSDGSPCGGQGNDDKLAANLIRVCDRCRSSGIEVYGFGVGTEAPKKFYGEKSFIYLESIEQMSEIFLRNFAKILTQGALK